MSATHVCAIPGCGKALATRFLMCKEHWDLVPIIVRNEVNRTWLIASRPKPFAFAENAEDRIRYRQARHVAICCVIEQQNPNKLENVNAPDPV